MGISPFIGYSPGFHDMRGWTFAGIFQLRRIFLMFASLERNCWNFILCKWEVVDIFLWKDLIPSVHHYVQEQDPFLLHVVLGKKTVVSNDTSDMGIVWRTTSNDTVGYRRCCWQTRIKRTLWWKKSSWKDELGRKGPSLGSPKTHSFLGRQVGVIFSSEKTSKNKSNWAPFSTSPSASSSSIDCKRPFNVGEEAPFRALHLSPPELPVDQINHCFPWVLRGQIWNHTHLLLLL